MATFILKWNPAISSYTMTDFICELNLALSGGDPHMNWSIHDHDLIRPGDTVYLLKVGHGATGIVAKGKVTSEAYEGADWSGKGRKTFYADFTPVFIVLPDVAPILTSQQLEQEIPDFDWYKGHSGLQLSAAQEGRLRQLWQEYMESAFGQRRHSLSSGVYFRFSEGSAPNNPLLRDLTNLGTGLYNAVNYLTAHPRKDDYFFYSSRPMEVARWLLRDSAPSLAKAYSAYESRNAYDWGSTEYCDALREALETFRSLEKRGVEIHADLPSLEKKLEKCTEYATRVKVAREKASDGEMPDDLRPLTDGFDSLNGKLNLLFDSELQRLEINHSEDFLELTVRNYQAETTIKLRFEGMIDYDISGTQDCECMEIYYGIFYRDEDRVTLVLEPLGEISADRLSCRLACE